MSDRGSNARLAESKHGHASNLARGLKAGFAEGGNDRGVVIRVGSDCFKHPMGGDGDLSNAFDRGRAEGRR